jgi:hypothetical protein
MFPGFLRSNAMFRAMGVKDGSQHGNLIWPDDPVKGQHHLQRLAI